jgi:predicted flap endonuclease-1-like 5' DNA nuclease
MRLDYALYLLASIFFLITVVSALMLAETERNLWVVSTVVLGLFSVGLGYYARPKVKSATQPAAPMPQTQKPITAAVQEQKAPVEAPAPSSTAAPAETPAAPVLALTEVKGIGEKRAMQLKALGISSVEELATASAEDLAKNLKISPKTVDKWIASAKELAK